MHVVDETTGERCEVECEMLVNAAGMWGMQVGAMAGVRIPATAVEHQYMLSGPIEGYTPVELGKMPTMRDPDHLVYYKPDGPGLLLGDRVRIEMNDAQGRSIFGAIDQEVVRA